MPERDSYDISVVMAVYKNDKPMWLKQAIDSILAQTCRADEFIVVVDGPISTKLSDVLDSYEKSLRIIFLEENRGLWNALNIGILAANNELIARMDADDVALPNRLATQVDEFRLDSDLGIVGGQVAEFVESIDSIVSYRHVPENHEDIVKFAKFRSPFNHPTVMYKKSLVCKYGGYSNLARNEDYDLWVRLLMGGEKMKNSSEVLVYYRLNRANMQRKNSKLQLKESIHLHYDFYKRGFVSLHVCMYVIGIKSMLLVIPTRAKYIVYKGLRRRRAGA